MRFRTGRCTSQLYGAVIKILLLFYAIVPQSAGDIAIEKMGNGNYEELEGAPYMLTCSTKVRNREADNATQLRITWQHKDVDIEPTARRYPVSTNNGRISHLKFLYLDRHLDAGQYRCEVHNITIGALDGSAVAERLTLNVIWVDIPQVVVVDVSATSVTLHCKFNDWSNSQMISIQWLHNLVPAAGPLEESTSRNFTIRDTSAAEKSGTYHCQVTAAVHLPENSTGLRGATSQKKNSILSSNWYTLVANDSRSQIPRFDVARYRPFVFASPGRSFVLECPFIGADQGSLAWCELVSAQESAPCDLHTTKSIDSSMSNLYQVQYNAQGSTLLQVKELRSKNCPDYSNYQCYYSGPNDLNMEQAFVYSVRPAESQVPAILHLVATPASYVDTSMIDSEIGKLRLCLTAVLKPVIVETSYKWLVPLGNNWQEPQPGPAYEFNTLSNGNLQLCIKSKSVTFGKYFFSAQNAYGNASAQIDIARWRVPQFESYIVNDQEISLSKQSVVSVIEGGSVTIRCVMEAPPYPMTSVFWRRSQEERNYVLRYNTKGISINESTGVLQLTNVTVAEAGNYSCSPMMLFYMAQIEMPYIAVNVIRTLKVINATATMLNNRLIVTCTVESDQWGDGSFVNITTFTGSALSQEIDSPNSYTRVATVKLDRGVYPSKQYKCSAKSGLESVETQFAFKSRPNILMKPENTSAAEGDSALLHCKPDSDDWIVHWKYVRFDKYEKDCKDDNPDLDPCVLGNGSLRFRSTKPGDAGWWNCLVSLKGVKDLHFDYEFDERVYLTVEERVTDTNSITRTVTIVIASALAYLGLVMGITLWCSVRLVRKRKRRAACGADDTQMTTLLGPQPRTAPDPVRIPNGRARVHGSMRNGTAGVRPNGDNGAGLHPGTSPTYVTQQSQTQQSSSPHPSATSYPASNPLASPMPMYTAVHTPSNSAGSPLQIGSRSGSTPALLTPPSNMVYPQRLMPAYAWPIQDIRSSPTRGSCSTCDVLSANGSGPCPVHAGPLPDVMLSEQPQSVLSHLTNITSVSQQAYRHLGMPRLPVTNTPTSRSRASNDSPRPIARGQVQQLGRLGFGRFGEVSFGQLVFAGPSSPIRVAVKALAKGDEDCRREFEREIDTFRGLQHAFVTELIGVCRDSEPFLLLYEYPEWGTLKHFLLAVKADHERILQALIDRSAIDDQSPLPPLSLEQKIMMCLHVTAGMDYLANHERVHTDLACRNLLLSPNLSVKVGLLGIHDVFANEYYHVPYSAASSLNNSSCRSKPIPLRWMAPECVSYEIRLSHEYESLSMTSVRSENIYTLASDVWSFGMTAFEIFSYGELPFSSFQDQQVIETLKNAEKNPRLVEFATRHLARFANLNMVLIPVDNVMPDPRFNDFSCSPQTFRHILEQCFLIDHTQRPTFAEISAALGEQLADSRL